MPMQTWPSHPPAVSAESIAVRTALLLLAQAVHACSEPGTEGCRESWFCPRCLGRREASAAASARGRMRCFDSSIEPPSTLAGIPQVYTQGREPAFEGCGCTVKDMSTTQTLIAEVYSAFNRRDVDAVLALMSEEGRELAQGIRRRTCRRGKKTFAPTGRVSGGSLIRTWNRWK